MYEFTPGLNQLRSVNDDPNATYAVKKLLALVWKVLIMILTTEYLLVKKILYRKSRLVAYKTGSTFLSKKSQGWPTFP